MIKNKPKVMYLEEALEFIESIPQSAGDKLLGIIHRIEGGERNSVLFSKLEGTEIWEFRTLYNRVKYRLFAFWDTQKDTLVIATHGIIKKTQKTPKKEIVKAEKIRQEYFNAKKNDNGTGW
ncbi:MAG: type II toxin-antitoxin system RelE/ParE family toxin [Prevotella sp.]|nr:type II toxin-antitoxin system RelE/ParE family toxin [Prevotella sp.]